MRAINEPVTEEVANAWGQYSIRSRQMFEIEVSDVRTTIGDYLGQRHDQYTFHHKDIGRVIEKYWDNRGWHCWSFI